MKYILVYEDLGGRKLYGHPRDSITDMWRCASETRKPVYMIRVYPK